MSDSLFVKGAESLARMALKRARDALVDAQVTSQGKRTAVVALLAIPWSKDLIRKMGTRNLPVVISAAASRLSLSDISRRLRRTIFELWRVDLSNMGGGDGRLWGDVLVKAHLFARLSPVGRKNLFSDLGDVLIFTPGDLRSVPLLEPHLVSSPNVPGGVLRELWNAAHAFGPRSK